MLNKIREVKPKYGKTKTTKEQVREASQIASLTRSILGSDIDLQEHFLVYHLDGAHQVIGYRTVTIGLVNCCQVHPREVFQSAILDSCVAIIVAHNHPSGSLVPSSADRELTERLVKAGDILGIKLLDHLIVTRESHFSFNDTGIL
jgi:DNA repair protein RadC